MRLFFDPASGIIITTFGTASVFARVITIAIILTLGAEIDAAAHDFGVTSGDVVQCSFVAGEHVFAVLLVVFSATSAEYFSQLRHSRDSSLQFIHKVVDDVSRLVLSDFGEMGIDSSSSG